MPATPADAARYTNDGVVLSAQDFTIRDQFIDARDLGDGEFEMFFDNPDHAQAMLDEKFTILSALAPPHEGVEVPETLGLGTDVPIAPQVPCFLCIDPESKLNMVLRCVAYAYDMGTDRYSVEVRL